MQLDKHFLISYILISIFIFADNGIIEHGLIHKLMKRIASALKRRKLMGRGIFSLMLMAVPVAFMMACMSCSDGIEENTLLEIKRLQARNEIQNLMGRYAFYHSSGLNFMAAQRLFTTYDDTVIEMMWGRYTGNDAARRCFTVAHRIYDQPAITALKLSVPELTPEEQALINSSETRNSPAPVGVEGTEANTGDPARGITDEIRSMTAPSQAPADPLSGVIENESGVITTTVDLKENARASLRLQALTTPVIEVAGDGETARAVWISPGMEGTEPAWIKFGCDFRKQDEEWKIWHLHVYGLMTGSEVRNSFTPDITPDNGADKAPTTNWEFSRQAVFTPYEPEPPQPYDTWDYATIQPKSYGDPN